MADSSLNEHISFEETKEGDLKNFQESVSINGAAWPLSDMRREVIFSMKFQFKKEKRRVHSR